MQACFEAADATCRSWAGAEDMGSSWSETNHALSAANKWQQVVQSRLPWLNGYEVARFPRRLEALTDILSTDQIPYV